MNMSTTSRKPLAKNNRFFFKSIRAMLVFALTSMTVSPVMAGGGIAFGPSIPIDDPTFCFGENSLGQCVMFYGSKKACDNVNRCTNTSVPSRGTIVRSLGDAALGVGGNTFCYGHDELTGQCTLYFGSEAACASLDPCFAQFKRLPRTIQ